MCELGIKMFLFGDNLCMNLSQLSIISDAAAMTGGAAAQYFSLRWNNHPVNLVSVFTGLYQVRFATFLSPICASFLVQQAESLVDVSLAAEGKHLQAHKVRTSNSNILC